MIFTPNGVSTKVVSYYERMREKLLEMEAIAEIQAFALMDEACYRANRSTKSFYNIFEDMKAQAQAGTLELTDPNTNPELKEYIEEKNRKGGE